MTRLPKAALLLLVPIFAACALVAVSAQAVPDTEAQERATRGQALFEKNCTGCHSLTANKQGPMLGNVFGRKAGTAPGYAYSSALQQAKFTWDERQLDRWLTDTESVAPGNDMDFSVAKPQDRAEIVSYLKSLSNN